MEAASPGIRVLVADDDPLARELVTVIVMGDGALELVATAEDADGAVEMAAAHKPDVALLDWSMPGGGGPAAARGIRGVSPATRIIGHTASDGDEAAQAMLEAGAQSLLVKGGLPSELTDAIKHAKPL